MSRYSGGGVDEDDDIVVTPSFNLSAARHPGGFLRSAEPQEIGEGLTSSSGQPPLSSQRSIGGSLESSGSRVTSWKTVPSDHKPDSAALAAAKAKEREMIKSELQTFFAVEDSDSDQDFLPQVPPPLRHALTKSDSASIVMGAGKGRAGGWYTREDDKKIPQPQAMTEHAMAMKGALHAKSAPGVANVSLKSVEAQARRYRAVEEVFPGFVPLHLHLGRVCAKSGLVILPARPMPISFRRSTAVSVGSWASQQRITTLSTRSGLGSVQEAPPKKHLNKPARPPPPPRSAPPARLRVPSHAVAMTLALLENGPIKLAPGEPLPRPQPVTVAPPRPNVTFEIPPAPELPTPPPPSRDPPAPITRTSTSGTAILNTETFRLSGNTTDRDSEARPLSVVSAGLAPPAPPPPAPPPPVSSPEPRDSSMVSFSSARSSDSSLGSGYLSAKSQRMSVVAVGLAPMAPPPPPNSSRSVLETKSNLHSMESIPDSEEVDQEGEEGEEEEVDAEEIDELQQDKEPDQKQRARACSKQMIMSLKKSYPSADVVKDLLHRPNHSRFSILRYSTDSEMYDDDIFDDDEVFEEGNDSFDASAFLYQCEVDLPETFENERTRTLSAAIKPRGLSVIANEEERERRNTAMDKFLANRSSSPTLQLPNGIPPPPTPPQAADKTSSSPDSRKGGKQMRERDLTPQQFFDVYGMDRSAFKQLSVFKRAYLREKFRDKRPCA